MKTTLLGWKAASGWPPPVSAWPATANLVLCVGATALLKAGAAPRAELRARFPTAVCAGCSTAGEILGTTVRDDSLAVLCVEFDLARVRAESVSVADASGSAAAATELGRRLAAPALRHGLVLSDGLAVNGTTLTSGFRSALPPGVSVTGGLAGDGAAFKRTLVGLGAEIGPHRVVAIGCSGESLPVAFGSAGGWEASGPRRLVTKSTGHVLFEPAGQPALPLDQRSRGARAAGPPATGRLFPLSRLPHREAGDGLVRTSLTLAETRQSLTFADDISRGADVRLMQAGSDALVGGAQTATHDTGHRPGSAFAVLVSCVGRKLVPGQRVQEEVETVLAHLGTATAAAGFYADGEIGPSGLPLSGELHNQTMTLTVFRATPPAP